MELLPLLCLCLLTRSGVTSAQLNGSKNITVKGGTDAVLPCSLSTKENIEFKLFDWRKVAQKDDGQKEVFLYNAGIHYNNGRGGQSEEFKGRVSHFQDELKHGNASIIIRNTTISDSGNYTCDFPNLQPPQIFYIEFLVKPDAKVLLKEDRDVMLPCSLSTKENIKSKEFKWKKVTQKDPKNVLVYNGRIDNNLQHKDFIGRVFHFPDELKHGNASIIIRNTKISDSGVYTCHFPHLQPPQTFYIELVVGAAPEPFVTTHHTNYGVLLQCEVHGTPKPKVEWLDSAGKILPAEEPQVSERGGRFYITLNATVTETDDYRCVATQETISHQIFTRIYVNGASPKPYLNILETKDGMLLQCEVLGASPEPEVKWEDSDGNMITSKEPQVTKKGGSYDVILHTSVTKTGHYRCVVTQKTINHSISDKIYVPLNAGSQTHPSGFSTGWTVGLVLLALLVALFVLAVLVYKRYITLHRNKGSSQPQDYKDVPSAPLSQPSPARGTDEGYENVDDVIGQNEENQSHGPANVPDPQTNIKDNPVTVQMQPQEKQSCGPANVQDLHPNIPLLSGPANVPDPQTNIKDNPGMDQMQPQEKQSCGPANVEDPQSNIPPDQYDYYYQDTVHLSAQGTDEGYENVDDVIGPSKENQSHAQGTDEGYENVDDVIGPSKENQSHGLYENFNDENPSYDYDIV